MIDTKKFQYVKYMMEKFDYKFSRHDIMLIVTALAGTIEDAIAVENRKPEVAIEFPIRKNSVELIANILGQTKNSNLVEELMYVFKSADFDADSELKKFSQNKQH